MHASPASSSSTLLPAFAVVAAKETMPDEGPLVEHGRKFTKPMLD
jgi:hypothetical protein